MTDDPRSAPLVERLQFLADTLNTRWTVLRSADDSARPNLEVDIPTRELDATITALRDAAAALSRGGETPPEFVRLMERRLVRDEGGLRRTPAGTLVYWDGGHAESFTTDPWSAVRWPTKEAAMRACPPEHYQQWGWEYVEHGFSGGSDGPAPAAALQPMAADEQRRLISIREDCQPCTPGYMRRGASTDDARFLLSYIDRLEAALQSAASEPEKET